MRSRYLLVLGTALLFTACSGQKPVTSQQSSSSMSSESRSVSSEAQSSESAELPPQSDPQRSIIESAGKAWALSPSLSDKVAVRELLPLKKQCGSLALSWKYDSAFPYELSAVLLTPGSVDLVKSGEFDKVFDVSFSLDCKQIYAIASRVKGASPASYVQPRDIYAYTIANGSWKAISHDLSPAWDSLENAKPAPEVLYPLDNQRLFIYAMQPTTGGDAYTDQSSKGVFDIQKGTVQWVEDGGGLPPAIFQPSQKLLSVFKVDSEGSGYVLVRTDVQLPQGTKKQTTLLKDPNFDALVNYLWGTSMSCIRVNFYSAAQYTECMDAFWAHAFSR